MPTTYTESKCDACPRACRAGVFIRNGGLLGHRTLGHRTPATYACPAGTPSPAAWVIESYDEDCPPSFTLDRVTRVTAVHAGTMLLGCEKCGKSPCLLEITGPADRLPCVLGIEDRPVWHRVTS